MTETRIHRVRSADGTEIAGRVVGQGPPLVLVHGGLEDGDLVWSELAPRLAERFTCYLMSTRGRGMSGNHPDLSGERLVEDVCAVADSIGEPVALLGESSGGALVLGAAARSVAVSAVAAYEPAVFEVIPDEDAARMSEAVSRAAEAAEQGRLPDAARAFAEPLVNDDELAGVSASSYFDDAGRYVPVLLEEIRQSSGPGGYHPTDPTELGRIAAPVLLLYGDRSALRDWFAAGVRHVAEHAPDARVREIPGAGHWGPVLHPGPIAAEVIGFLEG